MNEEVRRYLRPQEPEQERGAAEAVLRSLEMGDQDVDPAVVMNRLLLGARLLHTESGASLSLLIDSFRDAWQKMVHDVEARASEGDVYMKDMLQRLDEARPYADRICNLDLVSVAAVRKEIEEIRHILQ